MELRQSLAGLSPADHQEARHLAQIRDFVAREARPFDRGIAAGHLTGSAFVVETGGTRVLLLHHRKLQRWLQPGGHADPHETEGEAVALREAREETGLAQLALHPTAPRPLDVDVHRIPARPGEPEHDHLDLRYLVVVPDGQPLTRNALESNDLRWFSWSDLPGLGLDAGLTRGLAKARMFWP